MAALEIFFARGREGSYSSSSALSSVASWFFLDLLAFKVGKGLEEALVGVEAITDALFLLLRVV